ncbi:unnamed protein product, partial [marine sediment metagenome]
MADKYMVLRPGLPNIWNGTYVIDFNSDGYWQKGISKSYTKISTGQYAGQTNIVVAGATDEHTNAVVQDERTGLVWSAGASSSVGPGADGLLYWDDHCDVIEHDGAGTTFTKGDLITQLNTGETGVARYMSNALNTLGIVNASIRPFSTAAANTITGVANGGPAVISPYHKSSKEDIWEYLLAANESSMAGHSDWRIPNFNELLSLADLSSVTGFAHASTLVFDRSTDFTWSASKQG